MSFKETLMLYGTSLAIFFLIDMIWLGAVARGFYRRHLGGLLSPDVRWGAALLFYLLYIAGLLVFVVRPARLRGAPLEALLFGAAGLVFDRRSPRKLRYWQSVRLSIMAVSPTILLKTAMQSLGLTFPLDSFLLFAIALAYLWFGVTACAEEEEEARGECPPV